HQARPRRAGACDHLRRGRGQGDRWGPHAGLRTVEGARGSSPSHSLTCPLLSPLSALLAQHLISVLAALAKCAYDVILCDMRRPDLDGPGFYHALEQHHPHLRSWVIFLTGDVLSAEGQAFFAQSARPRVIKPFKAEEVRRVIQQVLEAQ